MERTRQVEITTKGRRGLEFLKDTGKASGSLVWFSCAMRWFSARWEEEKARGGEEAAERWACDRAVAEWQAEFGK